MWYLIVSIPDICTLTYLLILLKKNITREGSLSLHVTTETHILKSEKPKKKYHAWSCQSVCNALTILFDNIFIRFGTKLYRQVVGIPMGTERAPVVADLYLFCYERDFMMCLSDDKQTDIIQSRI